MREKIYHAKDKKTKLDKINLMEKGIPHNCLILYKNLINLLIWYKNSKVNNKIKNKI